MAEHCDAIDGIGVPQQSEVTNLTSFANEACDQVEIRSGFMKMGEHYTDVNNISDLKEYFSRPRLINTVDYVSPARGLIIQYSLSNTALQSRLTNFDRVNGAFGWRGTVCFRIQAIANPFQAGRVRLALDPCATNSLKIARTTAITPISQLPGVELDITESTSAVLKVPFIFPNNYFAVNIAGDGTYSLGNVALYAMTPVVLGVGASSPSIAVWSWVEDFEAIGAAAWNVSPQSGKFISKKTTSAKEEEAIPGNVSNVLAAGSKFATWMGTKVPLISSYAGATSWMMREAAKIAASYGWSKPLVTTPLSKMLNTYNTYQFNSDGSEGGYNAGMFSDNAVAPLPGFAGTDVDEMSLDYIKSIYAVVAQPSFDTSTPSNFIIYSAALCPKSFIFTDGPTNRNNLVPSPGLSYWPSPIHALGNVFEKYRGGFKFRIKMSKTKFHTGRLVVGFNPQYPSDASTFSVPSQRLDMQYKSVVWDLREGNVLEFECPFICPLSYLNWDQFYGSFFVAVLEPLAGPPSVSQDVPFVVEVAGMDDLEFAVPRTPLQPLSPNNTTFVAQSGSFQPFAADTSAQHALHAIGEKVNSVKQMVARAGVIATSTGSSQIGVNYDLELPEWDVPGAPTTISGVDSTFYNYFQSFYAFARGGGMLDVIPVGNDIVITGTRTPGTDKTGLPVISEGRTAMHLKYPYYCQRSRHLVAGLGDLGNPVSATVYVSVTNPNSSVVAYKRAADDFQLGYFVSAPPLCNAFPAQFTKWVTALTAFTSDH